MPNHSNIFLPQQRRARVGIIVAVLVLLQACSYGYEPEEPWGRESGRKIPDDQGIPIGQLVGRRDAPSEQKTARNIPGVDDPDYQEYLEWKEWQEFKRYQEWKRKQETEASQ